ncbi:hypothetical protein EG68_08876 [Paragonimus skrjabini miyazakii]|uniref:Uncharacterized protein n=1 Tax=Paragonimus skrjabini miyazakii TaxID=59628 RepID=A0A8S9Z0L1_9TREM|nr:hypothetical protein EG68_08876 [Paragonimus skrjabini miyazakii]
MEQQFNRRQGATNRTSSLGRLVLAKDCRDSAEKWTAGRILRRTGRVTYDVEVQSSIWGPLRKSTASFFSTDTFHTPQEVSAAAPNPEAHPPAICTPRRWTDRSRRQAAHMEVNPRQRSYEQ